MPESILTTTKAALDLETGNTSFDGDLIMHINSVLAEFNQLGIGPDVGYAITSADETWDDFLGSDLRYNQAKSLLFLKVKMLFDPPTIGYVLTAMEKVIDQAVWRLNVAREEIVHPVVSDETYPDELVILDGGSP
jgi:hypothetical protein